jgi:two-component system, OmpR family, phosphate regulon sensor histidine kinase PhoR
MTSALAEAVTLSSAGEAAVPEILVVDDELGYREGIRRILENRGYAAKTAANGSEALALTADHEYPIILVDLKMPEVDGFEVIEKVLERWPGTLCVVVSAFATIESAVQTTKMGAFDFVVKPFVPDDLMLVVNRAVDKWRLSREAQRLRAERESHLLELTAEKTRLRTIIQSIAQGLLVVNISGDVVLDNPMTRRLLGRVHASRLSGPVGEVLPNERFLAEIQRMLRGEGTEVGVAIEIAMPRAGAEPGYLRATLAPIRDERGLVLGVVVLLADITDAKAFERMKSLFVSMVAHELKAPLGAVEGYLNLLAAGGLDADPARRQEVINRCLQRTGALLELINDLTEMTRRDVGRHERRIEALDLAEVSRSIVEFHRNEAERQKVTLEMEVAPDLPRVFADRGDIERIATNFLSNAIKYNREGGRATLRLRRAAGLVVLEVEDTGIGMSGDERGSLGQDFFRAKNPKTRKVTGTGLGVALVKKIVESYQGALEVESVPDQGSTFRVLLPVGEGAAGAS